MGFTANEARVKAEREEYERLAEKLRTYLLENMKKGVYYTREGLYNFVYGFLQKNKIISTEENFEDMLLIHSDSILERTITLKGTYTRLKPQT